VKQRMSSLFDLHQPSAKAPTHQRRRTGLVPFFADVIAQTVVPSSKRSLDSPPLCASPVTLFRRCLALAGLSSQPPAQAARSFGAPCACPANPLVWLAQKVRISSRHRGVLAFFAAAGLALLALLYVAEATLEKGVTPIVTSSRVGLPEQKRPETVHVLTTPAAPEPDMTSQSVLAAQPKSKTKALANTASPSRDEMLRRLSGYGQNLPDRFSIRGQ
jgi:hypothetical protein